MPVVPKRWVSSKKEWMRVMVLPHHSPRLLDARCWKRVCACADCIQISGDKEKKVSKAGVGALFHGDPCRFLVWPLNQRRIKQWFSAALPGKPCYWQIERPSWKATPTAAPMSQVPHLHSKVIVIIKHSSYCDGIHEKLSCTQFSVLCTILLQRS